jgi:ABC-type lipoprotein export system ATPase subunit
MEIIGVFRELNRQGMTIILVTHEPDIARQAHRAIELRDGRIIKDEML